jgi:Spx/MgsR family transcriptional regulator
MGSLSPQAPELAGGEVVVLHGIAQCDQVRKAKAWLASAGIPHRFHDFRADGLDASLIDRWLQRLPWDALLNRRGTSWRKLDERQRLAVTDQLSARAAMLAEPLLVKRPVVEHGGRLLVGFSEPLFKAFFGGASTQGAPQ